MEPQLTTPVVAPKLLVDHIILDPATMGGGNSFGNSPLLAPGSTIGGSVSGNTYTFPSSIKSGIFMYGYGGEYGVVQGNQFELFSTTNATDLNLFEGGGNSEVASVSSVGQPPFSTVGFVTVNGSPASLTFATTATVGDGIFADFFITQISSTIT